MSNESKKQNYERNDHPLIMAVNNNRSDIVKALIKKGVDVTVFDNYALFRASIDQSRS